MEDLINNEVIVVTTTRTENVLEYVGTLFSVKDDSIVLKNAVLGSFAVDYAKKHAIKSGLTFYNNEKLETVVINKKYIISCIKK